MRYIEGVICDMDGTIVNSEDLHLEAWNRVLERHGCAPPSPDWCAECVGLPESHCLDIVHRLFPRLVTEGDLMAEKQMLFQELVVRRAGALAMPGVRERLKRLRVAGLRLAVATNSETVNTTLIMEASGLASRFSAIVTSDMAGTSKPHPGVYLTAARQLGLSPDRCAAVEDSLAGIESARAAGCRVLAVATTWPASKLGTADQVFDSTAAALEWLMPIRQGNVKSASHRNSNRHDAEGERARRPA